MALTAEDMKGFVGSLLAQRYDEPCPIPACHMEWWDMFTSAHRLVSIAAPRDHAKTTALTQSYGLAKVLFRESDFVFVVSDTEEQAAEFVTGIANAIKENDELQELFEIAKFEKDTETDIIVVFKDGAKFRFVARGVGQKVRGFKWGEKRPNLILIDDLENDKNVETKEQRRKLKKWVNGALVPCRSKSGLVRAVGTIIHSDSWLIGTMPKVGNALTQHTPLKDSSTRLTSGWFSALYRAHPAIGDYSLILWPEHHDGEYFKGEYQRLSEDGDTDLYSAENLNQPLDHTTAYFKRSDFIDFPEDARKRMAQGELYLSHYSSIDMAVSKEQKADYTVIGTIGLDETGQMYLVNVIRDRFDPDETSTELFKLEKATHPGMIFVEKGLLKNVIQPLLNKDMEKKRCYPTLEAVYAPGDKRTKARAIQKIMRGGGLYVDKQAEWYPAFEDEFLRFDRADHDDQVDMLALFGLKYEDMVNAPTPEEKEEEEWDEEHEETALVGKNKHTGY
jgi:predicted phage terminase large subunit-like protein